MRILIVGTSSDNDTLPPPPPSDPEDVDAELLSYIHGRQNARILVVDDDVAIGDVLTEILESEGYEIERAYDGVEAIRRITDEKARPFDLLVLDLMMPKAPGQSVLGYLGPSQWGDERDPHYLPLLVISAKSFNDPGAASDERFIFLHGSPRSARRGSTIPPMLNKPFDLPLLLSTVRKAIDRKRARHSDAE